MRITLIRHAQSEHNVSGNCGLLDPAITELGVEQALKAVKPEHDIIFCSTAQRALQTGSLMFDRASMMASDLFLECNTGVPCNTRKDLAVQKQQFPHVDFETYKVAPLPIEITHTDIHQRCLRILNLLRSLSYQKIVIITHANLIKALIYLFTGTYDNVDLENCGMISFDC
jgi:broad specificity phosphatase PhoE